jgi:ATP-binding cassette subfamily C protein
VRAQRLSNARDVAALVYGLVSTLALFSIVGLSPSAEFGVGEFLAFSAAFAQFQAAALAAVGVIPTVLAFIPTYERMRPILQATPEVNPRQEDPGRLRGALELRGVSFSYPDGPPVLDGVSIRAEPGEFVALVGPSGSGKSTCLRLLLGFERAGAGAVLVDGKPLSSLNPHLVRRQIGVVLQNSRPMVGSIFHNIVGSLPLTLDDAWRAARMVALDEDINALPMSMFTHVNQRGISFSGGQRQRLLIARALVADPRVLLLDEATSALDNRTQAVVTRSLAELGPTRVVVAHRLSTIRHADRIYVLDRGRVVQAGTFDELAAQPGLFARMVERQTLETPGEA